MDYCLWRCHAEFVLIYIGFPAAMALELNEHFEIYTWINAHISSSHLRFDLMEIYLMRKLENCVLIGMTLVATFLIVN